MDGGFLTFDPFLLVMLLLQLKSLREERWNRILQVKGRESSAELTLTAQDGVGTWLEGQSPWWRLEWEAWERSYMEQGQQQRQMNVSRGAGKQSVRWTCFSQGQGRLCGMPGGGEAGD